MAHHEITLCPRHQRIGRSAGKKEWALFLTTDTRLSTSKMLEVYALSWSIEVYFKEAKNILVFEGANDELYFPHRIYPSVCDSLPYAGVEAKMAGLEAHVGDVRADIQEQLDTMNFGSRLRQIFRAIISDTLHGLQKTLGSTVERIMQLIGRRVHDFLFKVFSSMYVRSSWSMTSGHLLAIIVQPEPRHMSYSTSRISKQNLKYEIAFRSFGFWGCNLKILFQVMPIRCGNSLKISPISI